MQVMRQLRALAADLSFVSIEEGFNRSAEPTSPRGQTDLVMTLLCASQVRLTSARTPPPPPHTGTSRLDQVAASGGDGAAGAS